MLFRSVHASLPSISYSRGLAMGRIAGDRIETMPYPLVTSMRCDSLDAMLGTVSNGLGIAWLPWSMVASDCKRGSLIVLGGRSEQIAFEVRSEERRVGKECVRPCRSRWAPYH